MSAQSFRTAVLQCLIASSVFLLVAADARAQQPPLNIPNGTILPVRLNHEINSKKARSGQVITGKIMQDVPLPEGGKIPRGSIISGIVVSSMPASQGQATVEFRFDTLEIHHQKTTIATHLRALASPVEVSLAQVPETSPGFGTPWEWTTTRQIGGDEVYGRFGVVTDVSSEHVGTSVLDGVLVQPRSKPGSKCRGLIEGANPVQAMWVFSSDACGLYGYEHLVIQHAGRSEPNGQITLISKKGEVKLPEASGMLLRTQR